MGVGETLRAGHGARTSGPLPGEQAAHLLLTTASQPETSPLSPTPHTWGLRLSGTQAQAQATSRPPPPAWLPLVPQPGLWDRPPLPLPPFLHSRPGPSPPSQPSDPRGTQEELVGPGEAVTVPAAPWGGVPGTEEGAELGSPGPALCPAHHHHLPGDLWVRHRPGLQVFPGLPRGQAVG